MKLHAYATVMLLTTACAGPGTDGPDGSPSETGTPDPTLYALDDGDFLVLGTAMTGENTIPFDEWVKLDIEYIDTWGLVSDLRLLLKTVPAVLSGTGAT